MISGSPRRVLDQLVALREETGHFGTLLMGGHDWDRPPALAPIDGAFGDRGDAEVLASRGRHPSEMSESPRAAPPAGEPSAARLPTGGADPPRPT